jgi:hypothetical protein
MQPTALKFLRMAKHPLKFRMFLLYKLPAAFFSGVRVKEVDESKCIVSIPYKWLTQNPFGSAYFASLSMAAEMSTGVLAMMYLYKTKPAVSMLVTKMEAHYFKKATGKTYFICEQGKELNFIIQEAIQTGEPKEIVVRSAGTNIKGEKIADFDFTWSFKSRISGV